MFGFGTQICGVDDEDYARDRRVLGFFEPFLSKIPKLAMSRGVDDEES
jgi:hypothetical protein